MAKNINDVIDFATSNAKIEHGNVPVELISAGFAGHIAKEINTETINHYTDPTEQFFTGIWSSSVGAKSVNYTEEEVCVILEGRVRLSDLQGNAKEFGAGSTFVLPAGFKGTWETLEAVKKIYVIWQPK
jgi:uncharacterized protein